MNLLNHNVRIIAKLEVKPPFVVKPIIFEGLRRIGGAKSLARKYYLEGADEILYIDVVASLYQRELLLKEVESVANEVFIPLCAGGGVQSIDDFSRLFHNGADKVAINTHAIQRDPNIIDRAVKIFGSQGVVVNIEAKKWRNNWECYSDSGKIQSGKDVFDWSKEVESRGAGEIILQSVDNDGVRCGFDLELAKGVVDLVEIPTIIASGAGTLEDIKTLIQFARPSGVAIATMLHYSEVSISEIKQYLKDNDIKVSL